MKKALYIIFLILASCSVQKKCCAQIDYIDYIKNYDLQKTLKKHLKFSTVYGAVNGGTSVSDAKIFSVTSGQLEESIISTPYDYSVTIGIRKIARFGYENRANTFYDGTESNYTDAATVGKVQGFEYLFEIDYARQQAIQRQSDFSQRINDRQAQIDRVMSMTQQPQMAQQPQMGQLQKQPMNNEEMNAFMQTPTGQGFMGLNEQIKDLGAGLGQAIQNNAEMIGKLDPIKLPSLSNQNVLNSMSINGLGNLFGTRSSYGN